MVFIDAQIGNLAAAGCRDSFERIVAIHAHESVEDRRLLTSELLSPQQLVAAHPWTGIGLTS